MLITEDVLARMGVNRQNAQKYLTPLNDAMASHGIDTALRIAHFLAQVVHESNAFRHVEERLNYSTDRLLQVFPKYFPNRSVAQAYAGDPQRIASRVYGARMGNGPEGSGDGYRYRGRGLMQLTGRNNYASFSSWCERDAVADPDCVAREMAAHSAVFFWGRQKLNALADTDNIKAITRAVNGGLNGFDHRFSLLQEARRALSRADPDGATAVAPDASSFVPTHKVVPLQLNLRHAPRVAPQTVMALLPQSSEVQVLPPVDESGWARVRVLLSGVLREGYVAQQYLAPLKTQPRARSRLPDDGMAVSRMATPPAVHLKENRRDVTRQHDGDRIFPLGEARRPARRTDRAPSRALSLLAIVDYLDSSAPEHLRYAGRHGDLHGNTYACDYCLLAGVYLPRVWWTASALVQLAGQQPVDVAFDRTVREVSTNGLSDWLDEFGPDFGWYREVDLTTLQAAANTGEVCLIVARRRDLNAGGDISAVVPESPRCEARRDAKGEVLRPVESYAGARNGTLTVRRQAWWLDPRFAVHAFWRHP